MRFQAFELSVLDMTARVLEAGWGSVLDAFLLPAAACAVGREEEERRDAPRESGVAGWEGH